MKTIEILEAAPVIPVMVIERLEDAVPMAEALVAGGLPVLEITLRSPVALDAIKVIQNEVEGAIVGSGTVINAETFHQSLNAGVEFMVSPGANSQLLGLAQEHKAKLLPR